MRQTSRPSEKYDLAFLGYEANPEQAELELTYNYGVDKYDLGTAYGHIAVEVVDCAAVCAAIKALGGSVTREGE